MSSLARDLLLLSLFRFRIGYVVGHWSVGNSLLRRESVFNMFRSNLAFSGRLIRIALYPNYNTISARFFYDFHLSTSVLMLSQIGSIKTN